MDNSENEPIESLVAAGYEWECPACGEIGDYASLRKPFDRGVDQCPNCSTEVECLD